MTKRLFALIFALLFAVPALAQRPVSPMISGATSTGESKTLLVTAAGAVVLSTGTTTGLQRPVSQMVAGADSSGNANITLLVDSDGALVVSGGTGIGGSIAVTQVAFGAAADEIEGEAAFTYDKSTNTLSSDIVLVAESAYGVGWNGSLAVPTRNAVYDKIETLVTAGTGANTQCAYWTSATTIAGDTGCTYNAGTDTLTAVNIVGSTSVTASSLTATRVTFAGAAGLLTDDSGMTFVAATDTMTNGAIVLTNAGAASLPMLSITGATFAGGSATTTKPTFLVEPTGATSTNWPTTGTLIGANAATGTPDLINLQLNGASRMSVSSAGNLSLGAIPAGTGQIRIANNTEIRARNAANSDDVALIRTDGSNNVIIGSVGGSLNAMVFRTVGNTGFVFNDTGVDVNFLISTDSTANAFLIDGTGAGTMTIGTVLTANALTAASGTPNSICQNDATKEITVNAALTCTVSSREQKAKISSLSGSAMEIVKSMRPVSFRYNDRPDRVRWGFIAEDLAAQNHALGDGYDASGIARSIDQNAILAVTVKALQEAAKRIEYLEKRGEKK
jgi:hypothetical protein